MMHTGAANRPDPALIAPSPNLLQPLPPAGLALNCPPNPIEGGAGWPTARWPGPPARPPLTGGSPWPPSPPVGLNCQPGRGIPTVHEFVHQTSTYDIRWNIGYLKTNGKTTIGYSLPIDNSL